MERQERSAFSLPVAGKAVGVAFDAGSLTSDVGVLVLAESPPDIPSWLGDRTAAELAALGFGLATLVLGSALLSLRGRVTFASTQLERLNRAAVPGLPVGSAIPPVRVESVRTAGPLTA